MNTETERALEALNFVWKHGKGALCACGKEDTPCLGCNAIKTIRHALQQNEKLVGALKDIVDHWQKGGTTMHWVQDLDAARKALAEYEKGE